MSSLFTLAFGMVPEANQASNWKTVADWVRPSCFAELLSFALTGSLISLQVAASSDRAVLTDLASRCASDRALKGLVITGQSGEAAARGAPRAREQKRSRREGLTRARRN